jgi:hypothetical protein
MPIYLGIAGFFWTYVHGILSVSYRSYRVSCGECGYDCVSNVTLLVSVDSFVGWRALVDIVPRESSRDDRREVQLDMLVDKNVAFGLPFHDVPRREAAANYIIAIYVSPAV